MATKNRSASNGRARTTRSARNGRWLARLGMYHTKRALRFQSAQELKTAIETLWNPADELYGMPRAPAGALTMIVPEEAVSLFRARGFVFIEYPVAPATRGARRASGPSVA